MPVPESLYYYSCRPRSTTLFKMRPFPGVSCQFCEIWKNTFSYRHLWWLLLVLQNRCSYKFPNIHQKISVLKSLFNTARDQKAHNFNKKETPTQVFSCEYHTKVLIIAVLQNTPGGCF